MAKLYFRYGTMNCGKSTELLQTAYNYGDGAIILKPSIDTKAEDRVSSRLGIERKVDYLISPQDCIRFTINLDGVKCILVDEVQFLNKFQINDLLMIATVDDIPVICYGLRTDFGTEGFEGSTRLLQVAHSIEELKTICKCGIKAIFNMRLSNGEPTLLGESVLIDGSEDDITYEPVCAKCYGERLELY